MTDILVSQEELDIMRHTTGTDRKRSKPFRNHFCAAPGHHDWQTLKSLTDKGLMTKRKSSFSEDFVFHVTDQGFHMLGFSGTDAVE